MIGIIVILFISWGLLFFIEKKNLSILGFFPVGKRFKQFIIGFIFLFLLNLFTVYIDTIVNSIEWSKNPDLEYRSILEAFWFHLKSTLTEELVFRGALLYILMNRLGTQKGIIISAIIFGIYHWFSLGVYGRLVPMVYIFIITGAMGYVWAYSFAKTRSIFLGFGLHLGINFLSALFSRSPTGNLIWIEESKVELSEWNNLFYLLAKGLAVPLLTLLLIMYIVKKETNQQL